MTQAGCSGARAVCLLVLTFATGCSFAMKVAPRDASERTVQAASECTSSFAAPIVDTLSAAVGAYNTAVSANATEGVKVYGISMSRGAGLALGVTQLAAFGIAATYGYIQAGRCHAFRAERHLEEPATPPTGVHGSPSPSTTRAAETSPLHPMTSSTDPAEAPNAPAPELPSWSAFRRVPLEPPPAPAHIESSRFMGSPR